MIDEDKLEHRKKVQQAIAFWTLRLLSFSIIVILIAVLGFIVYNGISVINWKFLTEMPEEGMTKGGIFPAIIGTLYLVLLSMAFAFPFGLFAGIYIQEYAKNGRIRKFILLMTSNLMTIWNFGKK